MIPDFTIGLLRLGLPSTSKRGAASILFGKRDASNQAAFRAVGRFLGGSKVRGSALKRHLERAIRRAPSYTSLEPHEIAELHALGEEIWHGDIDLSESGWSSNLRNIDQVLLFPDPESPSIRDTLPFTYDTLGQLDTARTAIVSAAEANDRAHVHEIIDGLPFSKALGFRAADFSALADPDYRTIIQPLGCLLSVLGIFYLLAALDAELAERGRDRTRNFPPESAFVGLFEAAETPAGTHEWWLATLGRPHDKTSSELWVGDASGDEKLSLESQVRQVRSGRRRIGPLRAYSLIKAAERANATEGRDNEDDASPGDWLRYGASNLVQNLYDVVVKATGCPSVLEGKLEVDREYVSAFRQAQSLFGRPVGSAYPTLYQAALSTYAKRPGSQ